MGEWGNGVFQNDLASDVKSFTLKLLGDGPDGETAVAEVFRTFKRTPSALGCRNRLAIG